MKEIIGQARYWVEENVSYLWISMKWAAFQDRERKIRLRLATIRVLGEDEQELCWSVGGGDVEERVLEVEQVRVIGRPELALDAVDATKRHQRRGSSCKSQRAGWVSRCEALSPGLILRTCNISSQTPRETVYIWRDAPNSRRWHWQSQAKV